MPVADPAATNCHGSPANWCITRAIRPAIVRLAGNGRFVADTNPNQNDLQVVEASFAIGLSVLPWTLRKHVQSAVVDISSLNFTNASGISHRMWADRGKLMELVAPQGSGHRMARNLREAVKGATFAARSEDYGEQPFYVRSATTFRTSLVMIERPSRESVETGRRKPRYSMISGIYRDEHGRGYDP